LIDRAAFLTYLKTHQHRFRRLPGVPRGGRHCLLSLGDACRMDRHTHRFVETYDGLIGFGFDRDTDEKTIICYLQKFSDDAVMAAIIKRLDDGEMIEVFDLINRLLRRHFTEAEYHRLFLKDK
jgi:hypothetical protein